MNLSCNGRESERLQHLQLHRHRKLHPGLAVPARPIAPATELRIFLRRRARAWKSAVFALAIAIVAVAGWAYLLARLG